MDNQNLQVSEYTEDTIGLVTAEFEAAGEVNILICIAHEAMRLTLAEARNLENSLSKLLVKVDDILASADRK